MSDLEMLVYMKKLVDDMLDDKPNNIGATFILEMGIFKNVVITCFREAADTKALT